MRVKIKKVCEIKKQKYFIFLLAKILIENYDII